MFTLLVIAAPSHGATRYPTPAWFYPQALCVHSGWHYTRVRHARGADYVFGPGLAFRRTWDVPDSTRGGSGEGGWDAVSSLYGGGLQFMLGTWTGAGGRARSTYDIARASPAEQIYRAYVVVRRDGGSWREWPWTSRACGLH